MNFNLMKLIISFCICGWILFSSCSEKNTNNNDNYIDFNKVIENDTFSFKEIPGNIKSWIGFYKKYDSLFTLSNFKASGVILHMEDLKISDTFSISQLKLNPLFEYSPDKLRYIDIWSYGQKNISNKTWISRSDLSKSLNEGEPDQQVVIGLEDGKRYELIFNGPSNISEIVQWLNNDQILISMITNENNNYIFELFIFDIKERLFTNYRLNHNFPIKIDQRSYLDFWINETDKLIK